MDTKPPTALNVQWFDQGEPRTAYWIVNVVDASSLPAPDELTGLTLEELLEVLTSARPVFEIVMDLIGRRNAGRPQSRTAEPDPHRRVDTSRYLLKRMRRASDAFEGMKERLEQPVSSLDAVRWRLTGPVGPVALATKLISSEGEAATFMVAELAATLRTVRWRAYGSLSESALQFEVAGVIRKLHAMTYGAGDVPSLAGYVESMFEELLN